VVMRLLRSVCMASIGGRSAVTMNLSAHNDLHVYTAAAEPSYLLYSFKNNIKDEILSGGDL
jgi:hypothetical protein